MGDRDTASWLAIIGMGWLLTTMSPSSAYVSGILPSLIIISLGMGLVFVPLSAVSLYATSAATMTPAWHRPC